MHVFGMREEAKVVENSENMQTPGIHQVSRTFLLWSNSTTTVQS